MHRAVIMALALSVLAAAARAEDDPEPPGKGGPELRKLKGKWAVTRWVLGGKERKFNSELTYEFTGDKVTVVNGKIKSVATVKVNAKNEPAVLELIREDIKTSTKMACKIDKGELFLVATPRNGDVQAGEDFSGKSRPLMVLTR